MFLLVLCMFKTKTTPQKMQIGHPTLPQYDLSSELRAFAQFTGFKFPVSWGHLCLEIKIVLRSVWFGGNELP